jgi:hypothetical protein
VLEEDGDGEEDVVAEVEEVVGAGELEDVGALGEVVELDAEPELGIEVDPMTGGTELAMLDMVVLLVVVLLTEGDMGVEVNDEPELRG